MQIDHITFSASGGAGQVALTLNEIQLERGLDSKVVSFVDAGLREQPLEYPFLTAGAALDNYLISNHTKSTLISVSRASAEIGKMSDIRNGSIVHLHWMEGVFSHDSIAQMLGSGRRIVWTLHDMAPFTGGCHHAHECLGFLDACSRCPQARTVFQRKVSQNLREKNVFDGPISNLAIVAPSNWLAERARRSRIFRDQTIHVIPNPVHQNFLNHKSDNQLRNNSGTDKTSLSLAFIAADLSDANKRCKQVVDSFMNARKNSQRSLELKLIGRNGRMFADLEGITYLGELQQTEIPEALTLCEALVSASNAESFGLTIAEAATLGVPSIVVSGSASSELLEDNTTGWVVQDFEELTSLFVRLSKQDQQAHSVLGLAAKAKAVVKHSPGAVSDLYAKVYEEIL